MWELSHFIVVVTVLLSLAKNLSFDKTVTELKIFVRNQFSLSWEPFNFVLVLLFHNFQIINSATAASTIKCPISFSRVVLLHFYKKNGKEVFNKNSFPDRHIFMILIRNCACCGIRRIFRTTKNDNEIMIFPFYVLIGQELEVSVLQTDLFRNKKCLSQFLASFILISKVRQNAK